MSYTGALYINHVVERKRAEMYIQSVRTICSFVNSLKKSLKIIRNSTFHHSAYMFKQC